MILENIKVKNFGVFRGEHVFDLTPDLKEKPIILFGGLNGSGKTTLFEGIKLCLYGQLSSKNLRTKSDYHEYLKKKILPLGKKEKRTYHGAIELRIQFNDFGLINLYSIRRSWKVDPKGIEENFRILKNGKLLSEVEREYSQAFLANLIPMGISNLFFFDGEKIQELAEDTENNGFFRDAVDSILGLDVIQTLINDLKNFSYRQVSPEDSYEIQEAIKKEHNSISSLDDQLQNLYQEKSGHKIGLERTLDEIEKKENELSLQGAGYAKKRVEYKDKLNQVERELVETRRKLREIYSGLFPFTIIPELCQQLRDRILEESRKKSEIDSLDILQVKKAEFSKLFFSSIEYHDVFPDQIYKEKFVDDIFDTFKNLINDPSEKNFYFINDFSEKELAQVMYWTDQSIKSLPDEIKFLSNRYEKLVSDKGYYENMLRRVPDDSLLDPIVSRINELFENKGRFENELNKIEEEINSVNFKLNEARRNLEILQEKLEQYYKHERKLKLLKNIQRLLIEYQDIIRKNKMDQLKEVFLSAIATILRKPNFITGIQIDPKTFQISLRREDGVDIDKTMLSNGEKQIYAISMLLALARVSGRPLPFIIDTPLARLDSSHRDNIVENFFPIASHQVIIFSTDTEIDKMYFEKLSPYISRVYHLKFDDVKFSTLVEEGYFWKAQELMHD